ncbi:alpha/beta hydrolase [Pseudoalteromonas shioyasakiensis]|uniref:alpha/beta fold hydrolase n=1 Tax=Pseudoalteromonas shioyasakiensis TaxID=1190813 RepID=UPI0021199EED|nr:alpha/beta hydrolase [Pseudoalteromonas shioyasakiensis]
MQSFSVQSGELALHGLTFGEGKEVVIALHGWLDNCYSFRPMLEHATLNATWYCIDFPGHGRSDWRSNDAHYYFVDYVDDVYNLIAELGVEKVHLVGHSMGAMVAGLFASCFAEKVISVTLIEGIGVITTPSEDVVKQLRQAITKRYELRNRTARSYSSKQQIYKARALSTDLPMNLIALLMQRNLIETDTGVSLRTDPKLKNHSGFRFDEAQCIAIIKEINVPCQLIIGEQGYPFVTENLVKYSNYFNGLNVVKVPGGHHCHMQSNEQCLLQVHAFMLQTGAC